MSGSPWSPSSTVAGTPRPWRGKMQMAHPVVRELDEEGPAEEATMSEHFERTVPEPDLILFYGIAGAYHFDDERRVLAAPTPLELCALAFGIALVAAVFPDMSNSGVDWGVVWLYAGAIIFGRTLDSTGAAYWLARSGVDVYFPCDRFVGNLLGHDAPCMHANVRGSWAASLASNAPVAAAWAEPTPVAAPAAAGCNSPPLPRQRRRRGLLPRRRPRPRRSTWRPVSR